MAAAKKAVLPVGTLDQIRAAKDLDQSVLVEVEEWGCTVTVRGLTRGEIKTIHSTATDDDDPAGKMDVLTLQLGLVDPAVTVEEAEAIAGEKGLRPVKKVLDAIMAASGLSDGFRQGKAG